MQIRCFRHLNKQYVMLGRISAFSADLELCNFADSSAQLKLSFFKIQ